MAAPKEIVHLIETFERNLDSYKGPHYNEAQLRREFIDPFFEALGWDIENKQGFAPAYREVINEDAIKVGAATKAPDYSFRIGGLRKFFVEAKKPAADIKNDPEPAYQLRRYAWSAKLLLSILTDFEEFAVYDCQSKPREGDSSSTARIIFLNYKDYPDNWDKITEIFSKDAILKGSFDKFITSTKTKKGTTTVDIEFLKEIENWRKTFAKTIAHRNRKLTTIEQINFAVQKTVDRILFLRMCEDRGIEPYGQLLSFINGDNVYPRLCTLFEKADTKYNSGLFHFKKEADRAEPPDELSLDLIIDDKDLKYIINSLYYPKSPYEFSVLPPEILGNVYEQFLGKVIRLTPARQVKIEEKPEVKKAGGVYYTPSYIVDYIVKNTVGKLIEGKTPKQIESIKILDPACGSGSFLLSAYTCLLNYIRDWYVQNSPEKYSKQIYQLRAGQYFLTIAEKKKILLNNIFGVDIDTQAVEVTKLSLLLKTLENENQDTLSLFRERALPDLANNIKCGNSLIGPDFFDNKDPASIDPDEYKRTNAFDWQKEFSQIFSRKPPGFDAVIGNPPYVRIQTMQETQPESLQYFSEKYRSTSKGNYDIYVVFVEKGINILSKNGRLGFILPHKFFNAKYGQPLRGLISKGKYLSEVVHFGSQQVFVGATTYTCLLLLENANQKEFKFVKVDDLSEWSNTHKAREGIIPSKSVGEKEWNFVVGESLRLFSKLNNMSPKLGDVSDIFVGLQTSADDVFIMNFIKKTSKTLRLKSNSLSSEWDFENSLIFPLVSGTDVDRYALLPERQYILFPYHVDNETAELIPIKTISKHYPQTAKYLLLNKRRLENREQGKFKGHDWHRFGRNQNIGIQERKKLCVPRLVKNLYAAFDEEGNHFLDNVDVGGITLKTKYEQLGLKYLLGLLNSKLLRWYFPFVSAPFRGGWLSANRQFLSQVPIWIIIFDNADERSKHDKMVKFVESMLDLHKKLNDAKIPDEKTRIQRQIDSTDRQIDRLVYDLYGLTDEEIAIVEKSG